MQTPCASFNYPENSFERFFSSCRVSVTIFILFLFFLSSLSYNLRGVSLLPVESQLQSSFCLSSISRPLVVLQIHMRPKRERRGNKCKWNPRYYPRPQCAPSLVKSRIFPPLQTYFLLFQQIFFVLVCIHAGTPRVPLRVLASGPKTCGGNKSWFHIMRVWFEITTSWLKFNFHIWYQWNHDLT